DSSTAKLELPEELKKRNIHPMFHMDVLRPHIRNDEELFPHRDSKAFYDFGGDDEQEWFVDEINSHRWQGSKVYFHVKWSAGDDTWEPLENCKDLQPLEDYLVLQNVTDPLSLPRESPRGNQSGTQARQPRRARG
ncbi:hypothetical protein SISNIDRAFT_390919, partial [Sistotremastrum niveocremeum HHB9708]